VFFFNYELHGPMAEALGRCRVERLIPMKTQLLLLRVKLMKKPELNLSTLNSKRSFLTTTATGATTL
jgi:hypothetical protein